MEEMDKLRAKFWDVLFAYQDNKDNENGSKVWESRKNEFFDALQEALTRAEERGRNQAVDFIWRNFTDEKFAEIAGDEEDEDSDEISFRIFFSDLLEKARAENLNG